MTMTVLRLKCDNCKSNSTHLSNNEQSSDLDTEKSPSDQFIEQSTTDKRQKRSPDEKVEKAMDTLVSRITKALVVVMNISYDWKRKVSSWMN